MCTLKEIQEAKKYLDEQGYGTGSNFTLNTVANLMAEWSAKNCNLQNVSKRYLWISPEGKYSNSWDEETHKKSLTEKDIEDAKAKGWQLMEFWQ